MLALANMVAVKVVRLNARHKLSQLDLLMGCKVDSQLAYIEKPLSTLT
jgi:hypothetical protein